MKIKSQRATGTMIQLGVVLVEKRHDEEWRILVAQDTANLRQAYLSFKADCNGQITLSSSFPLPTNLTTESNFFETVICVHLFIVLYFGHKISTRQRS